MKIIAMLKYATTISLCAFMLGASVYAADADSIVGDRQQNFKNIKDTVKLLANNPGTKENSLKLAKDLKSYASKIPSLFTPESKNPVKLESEALPKIWDNFDHFKSLAANLAKNADKLIKIIEEDDLGAQEVLSDMQGDCKACHKKYRK